MHPEARNSFPPLLQLDVGLEPMGNCALFFDKAQVVYSNFSYNGIGFDFASGEHFGLLQERLCYDS